MRNAVFSRNQNARNVGNRLYLWNRANLSVFTLSFCHLKERSGWKTAPHTSLSSILLKKVWLHRRCVPCEIFGNPVFCVWLFYSASSPNHPPDFPKGISRVCMHSVLVGTLNILNAILHHIKQNSKSTHFWRQFLQLRMLHICIRENNS